VFTSIINFFAFFIISGLIPTALFSNVLTYPDNIIPPLSVISVASIIPRSIFLSNPISTSFFIFIYLLVQNEKHECLPYQLYNFCYDKKNLLSLVNFLNDISS
jgi:hypothetical protein